MKSWTLVEGSPFDGNEAGSGGYEYAGGNEDSNKRYNYFPSGPMRAWYVKIQVMDWYTWPSMRVDVIVDSSQVDGADPS
jgi:hypothetical protein